LGLADLCSYEGEAAMYLESLASQYLEVHKNALSSYIKHRPNTILDAFQQLKMGLIDALVSDRDIGSIAANFHYTLVDIIIFIAEKAGVHKIAFSGGVFQNGLLVDMIIGRMKGNYQIYFHNELPANDENIAFGQLAHYHAIQKQRLS
jgi:hydrogenase maturation protein HypF